LVADAGHELRSPLAVLQAELELAARPGRTREELVAAVENAAEETRRLTRLAGNLLLLAQHDEGEPLAQLRPQPIAPVLREAIEGAAGRIQDAGVRLRLEVDDHLCAWVDADRLRQAIDNLLDNAIRMAPPASEVAIRGYLEKGSMVIEVSDCGPGFPDSFLPEAFERFRRADTARGRASGGAGLGLAIVRAIAEAHGGHAQATNRQSGGATVRIIVPQDSRPCT
jgi:signal transduction histidine kinase